MSSNSPIALNPTDLRIRLTVLTGVLLIIGLVALYSISDNPLSIGSSFFRQCIFILLSIFVYILVRTIPLKTIHDNSTTIFIGIVILCFIPFLLPQVEYTYRWIDLGFMTFQPSEYLKFALIIVIAHYLSNHQLKVKTKSIKGIKVESREQEGGPPTGKPINIKLTSNNKELLLIESLKLKRFIQTLSKYKLKKQIY